MINMDIKEYVDSMTDNLEKLKHCFIDDVYYKYSNDKKKGMTEERYLTI